MTFKIKTEFTKNVLKLISGTFIAQAVTILISPLLSRIYTPEEFGVFTLISSVFGLVALISSGRYEQAILLPKKDKEAANVFVLAILINFFFFILFYLVLGISSFFVHIGDIALWYYLLPVFVLLVGVSQVIIAWFNRRKNYREIVYYKISNSVLNNGFSLSKAILKLPVNGLLSAYLLANLISVLALFYRFGKDWKLIRSSYDRETMLLMGKKYRHFPLINSFQSILDAIQINGLIYFISVLFGSFYVGIFSFSLRILFMPMNFIGGSISQVFYQEASVLYHENKPFLPLMNKTLSRSLLIISPVLLVILFFGPAIFSFVFGKVWLEAGIYAQILCPWILLDFIRAPLSQIPLILNKQKNVLLFSIISNLSIFGIIFIGAHFFKDLKTILLILTVSQSVYIILLIAWIYSAAGKSDNSLPDSRK